MRAFLFRHNCCSAPDVSMGSFSGIHYFEPIISLLSSGFIDPVTARLILCPWRSSGGSSDSDEVRSSQMKHKFPHSVVGRCLNPSWQKSCLWTRGPLTSHITPNRGPNSKSHSLLSTDILQATLWQSPGPGSHTQHRSALSGNIRTACPIKSPKGQPGARGRVWEEVPGTRGTPAVTLMKAQQSCSAARYPRGLPAASKGREPHLRLAGCFTGRPELVSRPARPSHRAGSPPGAKRCQAGAVRRQPPDAYLPSAAAPGPRRRAPAAPPGSSAGCCPWHGLDGTNRAGPGCAALGWEGMG